MDGEFQYGGDRKSMSGDGEASRLVMFLAADVVHTLTPTLYRQGFTVFISKWAAGEQQNVTYCSACLPSSWRC